MFGVGWVPAAAAGSEKGGRQREAPRQVLFYLDHQDVSPPLREMKPIPRQGEGRQARPVRRLPIRPRGRARRPDRALQASAPTPRVSTTTGLDFDGLDAASTGFFAPPDTNGAVGATQYVQWVNAGFAVFDKSTGTKLLGPANGSTLWQGFGGQCEFSNDGDPIAQYDKAADRWVMTQFAVSSFPFFQCVAVSTSSDATGSYRRFAYSFTNFNDYPKLGVWPDGYYLTFNMFDVSFNFVGGLNCALDRNQMVTASGTPGPIQCFQLSDVFGGLLPSDLDGSMPPPAGSPNYFVAWDTDSLDIWEFHVDWATPSSSTFTGPTNVPVSAFTPTCGDGGTCIPQAGTPTQLDSLADRLMYRLAYRNYCGHESLVVNHSVDVGGVGSSGVRWYELRDPGGTPTVYQQGTFAPDAASRWMGSIAMDRFGDMLMGYSASSSSLFPAIRITGREPDDTLGTMQAEATVKAGGGSQNAGLTRWGDYSAMTVDPADDCTFWFTTEYQKATGSFNWSTRISSFKFAACPGPDFGVSTTTPTVSVSRNSSSGTGVTVTSLNGFSAATDLTVSGLPSGVTASFVTTPLTPPAGSSTQTLLTLTATPTATLGTFTVIVTGASVCLQHSAALALTVVVPPAVTVFHDGAESLPSGFSFSNTTNLNLWALSLEAYSGTYSWRAGAPRSLTYGRGDARMTTPGLDLTGAYAARLSYAYRYATQAGTDFFELRVSTNGGATWTTLSRKSGNSSNWPKWSKASVDAGPWLGLTGVQFQFRLVTSGSGGKAAYVDEVSVVKQ